MAVGTVPPLFYYKTFTTMTITINEKNIELKYSLRAMLMYENMTDKTFSPSTLTDVITYMYCVVISSSKDYSIKFDDFIDVLDSDPSIITKFTEWLNTVVKSNEIFKKN